MPPSGATVSKLLGLLYEASASPGHWPGFLSYLCESTASGSSYFLLLDSQGQCNLNLNHGFDPQWTRAYMTHFHQHDLVLRGYLAAKRAHGEWIGTRQSVIPDHDYLRSYIHNEFTKPQGKLFSCAAALQGLDGGVDGGLGLMRSYGERPFSKRTVTLLTMLAPHLRQALNTHRMLSISR